jgi:hypothetical protein
VYLANSDFAVINERLAAHYGLDGVEGVGLRPVSLPDASVRGGLLTQASVLKVTANGTTTSPVKRGAWIMARIVGQPPPPPPASVPAVEPDIRGATTIREQLQRHRNVASCNDCHRKIDPLGFALEHFDPIGDWRETYGGRTQIDASGELPSGQTFDSIEGFKKILVERQDQFATALTTKLLAYAIGRTLEPADRPRVENIVEELRRSGNGFRDLLLLVASSETFRAK